MDREGWLDGIFNRRTEMSPTAQRLFEIFKKAYNPDKGRFKDRGWRESFRRSVEEHAHDLKKELSRQKPSSGLLDSFWKSVKEVMPLEVAFAKYSSVGNILRDLADNLLRL